MLAEDRAYAVARLRELSKTLSEEDREKLLVEIERETDVAMAEVTSLPDHLQVLTWDEIRELSETGLIAVGSHSVTHPILTSCSDEALLREVTESRMRITQELGGECGIFCYPNGAESDFDFRTQAALLKAGYAGALITVNGSNDRNTSRFELRRHTIDDGATWPEFIARVDGLFIVVTSLLVRWNRFKSRFGWRINNRLPVASNEKE